MANPKYIDESLLPASAEDESSKKVSKKAYSFRCDETLLDDMGKYADLEDTTMPQLLSKLMEDFLSDKVLTNTYLPEYEGKYINIPSHAAADKFHEYEIRYVPNNLDVWNSKHGYISADFRDNAIKSVKHEGIDFVVIPETLHRSKLPDRERDMLQLTHTLNLNDLPKCLYCIYITVGINGTVEAELITWIEAINKLKAVERYDIIAHANKIKKHLEELHQDWISYRDVCDDEEMMWQHSYGRLLKIAKDYNTGAILPASKSIDNIEYAPIVETLPDNYDLINKLMNENRELKKIANEFQDMKDRMDKLDGMTDDEIILERISADGPEEIILQRSNASDDLPESDDES